MWFLANLLQTSTAADPPPECRTSQDEKLGLGITIYNNSYNSAETHRFPWKPVTRTDTVWYHHSLTTEHYHTISILKLKNWPCEWELSLAYPLPPARLRQNIVTAPSDTYFPFWHFNLLVLPGWLVLCCAHYSLSNLLFSLRVQPH